MSSYTRTAHLEFVDLFFIEVQVVFKQTYFQEANQSTLVPLCLSPP